METVCRAAVTQCVRTSRAPRQVRMRGVLAAMNHPPADLETLTLPQGLRGLFNRLEPHRPDAQQLEVFVEEAFSALRVPLRLTGVVVYAERRDGFELRKHLGWAVEAPANTLPPACPSLRPVLDHRVYIFDDPGEDDAPWNDNILPRGPSAGW